MKSINNIFKNNKGLLEVKEVEELIEYCNDLESEIIDLKDELKNSKEKIYLSILSDIHTSINEITDKETNPSRFDIEIDYKSLIKNLKDYMEEIKRIYKLRL